MNIHGHNWGNRLAQTWTEPAEAGFSGNRYIRNGPTTELFHNTGYGPLGGKLHRLCQGWDT